jgi:hypothetical protein
MGKRNTLLQITTNITQRHPGSKVVSVNYISNKHKLVIICENGHSFLQRYNNITMGQWCSVCSSIKIKISANKHSLDFVKSKVLKLHPNCTILGPENYYKGITSKIPAICENGHFFNITPNDLFCKGTWCMDCRNANIKKRKTVPFEERREEIMALHPNCTILTKKEDYVDGSTDLDILCECKKQFKISFKEIQSNRWCNFCKTDRTKKTNLKKYGVEYISQVLEIALKASKSLNNSCTKNHWKTGEELVCVGSYEAKTVDHLNVNKIDFKWQPKIFKMPNSKTYRPDLYLVEQGVWVEIKGWMRKDAQEKWDWFKTLHPTAELWDQKKLKEMGVL